MNLEKKLPCGRVEAHDISNNFVHLRVGHPSDRGCFAKCSKDDMDKIIEFLSSIREKMV